MHVLEADANAEFDVSLRIHNRIYLGFEKNGKRSAVILKSWKISFEIDTEMADEKDRLVASLRKAATSEAGDKSHLCKEPVAGATLFLHIFRTIGVVY